VGDDAQDVIAAPSHLGSLGYVAADECSGQVSELDELRERLCDGNLLDGSCGVGDE
jgi:hypothetical protein